MTRFWLILTTAALTFLLLLSLPHRPAADAHRHQWIAAEWEIVGPRSMAGATTTFMTGVKVKSFVCPDCGARKGL